MKSNPFISFVLPTRDRPDLIYKCLSFLKAQECEDFEVIIADNSVLESCEEKVACFLKDTRFHYKKAPSSLSMPDNWDFAIENAVGEYITVINEKFMFHPKAVGYIKSLSSKYELPDILSWQFEHFILSNSNSLNGNYHPLLKPVEPELYSAVAELERRFSFKEPLFSRHTQEKNGYGKIYSGAVKRGVVQKVKQAYGRVFLPMSPDFTSMVCFLNFSEVCLDLGRCLMLVVAGEKVSNGETTKNFLPELYRYIEETSDNPQKYIDGILFPELCLGHTVFIASDYSMIQSLNKSGNLSSVSLDKPAVLGWIKLEMESIKDWGEYSSDSFVKAYENVYRGLSDEDRLVVNSIQDASEHSKLPSQREIYHSGLLKVEFFEPDIAPEKLAKYHWDTFLALPRKPVSTVPMTIESAMEFYIRYTDCSVDLLGYNWS